MLLVPGWITFSKTIIPEAGSAFSSPQHVASPIFSVDRGLVLQQHIHYAGDLEPDDRGHPAYEYMQDGDGVVCE